MRASVVVECELSNCGSWALEHRLSSCGTWALLLHGMWDLPRPGIEPMPPALAGRFLTTMPPGKSLHSFFFIRLLSSYFRHSIFQLTYSFFCLSFSAIDSCSVFFISVIVLFIIVCLLVSSSRSLLNVSCIFSSLFRRF